MAKNRLLRVSNTVIVILLLAVLVGLFSAYIVYTQWFVQDIKQYKANFTVTDQVVLGFVVGSGENNDTLQFGKMPYSGGADRMASVVTARATVGRVSFGGATAPYLRATPSCFVLKAGARQDIQFGANIPDGTPLGDYEGTVRIIYTRPLPWNKC